jgi:RNA polymerase sigma-70 factor (ECF subfamily)
MVSGPSPFSHHSTVLADMPTKREPNKPPSTHLTLLARLRGSASTEAWATFVDLYTPLIYQFCRSRSLQDADARDVTQQVLAIVHRAIPQFQYDPERGRFRDWLGTTTLHELARYQRKTRRPGQGVGGGEDLVERTPAAADPVWIEEFNAYMFQLALERIRPSFDAETWRAFELTWLNDVNPHDAAEQLHRKTGWVYKARYRVIQQLRREIEFLTSDSAMIQRPR